MNKDAAFWFGIIFILFGFLLMMCQAHFGALPFMAIGGLFLKYAYPWSDK